MNERALLHAEQVRSQLGQLLSQLSTVSIDIESSCSPEREPILKCLAFGFFLQAATRQTPGLLNNRTNAWDDQRTGKNGMISSGSSAIGTSGRIALGKEQDSTAAYVTMRGGQIVHIHPSSVLFGASGGGSRRDRLPKHVVFAEQVITSKSYIRYVSRIDGSWLAELRPEFYRGLDN